MNLYVLELKIPFLPSSLNKALRDHHFTRSKNNSAWDKLIWLYVRNQLPPKPLTKVKITCQRYNWKALDYDGLVGSFKGPIDALETAKVIKKDSWKVTGKWDVDQHFLPKKETPYITIKIEEIHEGESK